MVKIQFENYGIPMANVETCKPWVIAVQALFHKPGSSPGSHDKKRSTQLVSRPQLYLPVLFIVNWEGNYIRTDNFIIV
jgi:hypothetical protein